jgi:hypothetical protein
LKASIKQAGFCQLGFNPKIAPAGSAFYVIAALHLSESCEKVFDFRAVEHFVKCGDSRWTSDE